MGRWISGIEILCAAAALCAPAAAQITITAADVSSQFTVGNFTTNHYDSTGSPGVSSINIGGRGSSSFDFSGLKNNSTIKLTSVSVAGTPYTTQFPGATFAFQTSIVYQGIPATGYIYFQLGTNLLNMGEGAGISGGAATLIATNKPADVFYALPSTYLTTWTSTYLDSTVIYLGTTPIPSSSVRHYASYIVDAYGPLTVPGQKPVQALRIKKTDSTVTYNISNGTLSFAKGVGFIYLAKDGTLVQVSVQSTTGPDTGTVTIYPPVSWAAPVNSSAELHPSTPREFSLGQNYPNPFNPSTSITYALPARSSVRLTVYNVLGQAVAEIVNGDMEAGVHSAEWHPNTASGVYYYRIDASSLDNSGSRFSKIMKMVYLR